VPHVPLTTFASNPTTPLVSAHPLVEFDDSDCEFTLTPTSDVTEPAPSSSETTHYKPAPPPQSPPSISMSSAIHNKVEQNPPPNRTPLCSKITSPPQTTMISCNETMRQLGPTATMPDLQTSWSSLAMTPSDPKISQPSHPIASIPEITHAGHLKRFQCASSIPS
jgi:hypothetical protein